MIDKLNILRAISYFQSSLLRFLRDCMYKSLYVGGETGDIALDILKEFNKVAYRIIIQISYLVYSYSNSPMQSQFRQIPRFVQNILNIYQYRCIYFTTCFHLNIRFLILSSFVFRVQSSFFSCLFPCFFQFFTNSFIWIFSFHFHFLLFSSCIHLLLQHNDYLLIMYTKLQQGPKHKKSL